VKNAASPRFWTTCEALPSSIRKLADANFALLKRDPRHPSLQFKKVGRYWSVRVGLRYRAWLLKRKTGIFGSGSARTPITID
jgi:hypothetical protein